MKITDTDRRIIAAAEFCADLPVPEIARITRLKPHVIYHALARLIAAGIVQRRAYFDSYLLGTRPFIVFATVPPSHGKQRHRFIQFLRGHSSISFLSDLAGRYNFWFEVRATDIFGVESILFQIAEKFGDILHERELLAMPHHADYPWLSEDTGRARTQFVETKVTDRRVKLDETDLRIMRAIAGDWMQSSRALAVSLGIPNSTLTYRIERLRSEGVIRAARLWINLAAVGDHQFLHLVAMRAPTRELRTRCHQFALKEHCVHMMRSLMGRWDYIFETHHQRPDEVTAFTTRLHSAFEAEIIESSSHAVLSFVKASDCTTPESLSRGTERRRN